MHQWPHPLHHSEEMATCLILGWEVVETGKGGVKGRKREVGKEGGGEGEGKRGGEGELERGEGERERGEEEREGGVCSWRRKRGKGRSERERGRKKDGGGREGEKERDR